MRKLLLLCVAVGAFSGVTFWSYSANAVTYTLQFTASGFTGSPPEDPISGIIVFDKDAADFSILSVVSVALTIDGHAYSVGELSFFNSSPLIAIGGAINGTTGIVAGTTDFRLSYRRDNGLFVEAAYTTPSTGSFFSSTGSATFTEGEEGVVPIPPAIALFASGLGMIGLLGWRRKRKGAAGIAA